MIVLECRTDLNKKCIGSLVVAAFFVIGALFFGGACVCESRAEGCGNCAKRINNAEVTNIAETPCWGDCTHYRRTLVDPLNPQRYDAEDLVKEVCEMANALFHPDKVAVTVLGNLDGLKLTKENLVF